MTPELSGAEAIQAPPRAAHGAAASDLASLRAFAAAAGIAVSGLFAIVAFHYQLQTYGDGSLFSYALAVQDAWAFHWHNIAVRASVYLYALLPAEIYVRLTGDAAGGIDLYGLLFYLAPLLGLAATFALDRSAGRLIFAAACLATACLCPLVFGFPTELWLAHALFWPALAACHYARPGVAGTALVLALLLALAFTHEGALVFAAAILASLLLRGARDRVFLRAACCLVVVVAAWIAVKRAFPPDDYYAPILFRAAFYLIDLAPLAGGVFRPLFAALAAYAALVFVLRRRGAANAALAAPLMAPLMAVVIVAAALTAYWWGLDGSIHAESRYAARTALLIATPVLGALAAAYALEADGRLALRVPLLRPLLAGLARRADPATIAGAIAVAMLVHAVETAKFVAGWGEYRAALRALAAGDTPDSELGDPELGDAALGDRHFVSASRLGPALNRLAWNSTTPFLSVLVAPGFAPARLVVDPAAHYFWLTCATATASEVAARALPRESRALVRLHACLHR